MRDKQGSRRKENRDPRQIAIRFYEALQAEFPHDRLEEHIANLKADAYDYWRNAGVAFDAITAHSEGINFTGQVGHSNAKYEKNRARLDEIRAQYAPDIMFQV